MKSQSRTGAEYEDLQAKNPYPEHASQVSTCLLLRTSPQDHLGIEE